MDSVRQTRRETRRRAFLDAAAELFMTKGYGATSLHDVVSRSGGSLATLYEIFGNKSGLFRALVEEKCNAASGMFDDAAIAALPPEQALTRFAYRLHALVTSDEARSAYRLICAEGSQFPEMADAFFKAGPDVGKARVAKYLAEQNRRGQLNVADPELGAHLFCSMICAGQELRIAAGLESQIPPEKVDQHLAMTVETFIRGNAPAKPA
jgi:TetR/AcrR family transcriptional repressor of mexJK operon